MHLLLANNSTSALFQLSTALMDISYIFKSSRIMTGYFIRGDLVSCPGLWSSGVPLGSHSSWQQGEWWLMFLLVWPPLQSTYPWFNPEASTPLPDAAALLVTPRLVTLIGSSHCHEEKCYHTLSVDTFSPFILNSLFLCCWLISFQSTVFPLPVYTLLYSAELYAFSNESLMF